MGDLSQKIYITIGVPRSGKTTWIRNHMLIHPNILNINTDEIRNMLVQKGEEDSFVLENEPIVWDIFYKNLESLVKSGRDFIISNTNCNLEILIDLMIRIKNIGKKTEFIIVIFDTPIAVCLDRAKNETMKGVIKKFVIHYERTVKYLNDAISQKYWNIVEIITVEPNRTLF